MFSNDKTHIVSWLHLLMINVLVFLFNDYDNNSNEKITDKQNYTWCSIFEIWKSSIIKRI